VPPRCRGSRSVGPLVASGSLADDDVEAQVVDSRGEFDVAQRGLSRSFRIAGPIVLAGVTKDVVTDLLPGLNWRVQGYPGEKAGEQQSDWDRLKLNGPQWDQNGLG